MTKNLESPISWSSIKSRPYSQWNVFYLQCVFLYFPLLPRVLRLDKMLLLFRGIFYSIYYAT